MRNYIKVIVFNYQEYLYLLETKDIAEEHPGEKNLTGSDIISTVKSASSEQEQNCKYCSDQTKVLSLQIMLTSR